MSDFRARIVAELDTSQINSSIEKLEKIPITFKNVTLDTSQINASIQNALNKNKFTINLDKVNVSNVASQMKKSGSEAGKDFANSFGNSIGSVNTTVSNTDAVIKNMQRTLSGMKFNNSSIDLVTKDLKSMNLAITNIKTNVSGDSLNMSIKGVDELGRVVTILRQFDTESGQAYNVGRTISQSFETGTMTATQLASAINKVTTAINGGSIDSSVSRVTAKFNQLNEAVNGMGSGAKATELQGKLKTLEADFTQLHTLQNSLMSGGLEGKTLVSTYESFNQVLSRIISNMNIVSNETKQFASAMEVATLKNKMESWLNRNTKATKECKAQINSYISELKQLESQGNVTSSDLNRIANGFQRVDKAAEASGMKGKSFGSSFSNAFKSITRYIGASTLIYSAFSSIKDGINEVVELDDALVDLKKTSSATASQLKEFYFSANDSAKELGVTTQEVIQAAADWSRLGYNLKDSQTMAEVSSIFSSISPGMDIETATDGLVSAMKAFNIEADDALDGIASKINAIGNTQAVDNGDIVDFLTRSSSAMSEANNSLEETIALGTAATEITRDAAGVGNALKTSFFNCLYVQKCA